MENFSEIMKYYLEYELYNNILSSEIKDKKATDILLEDCTYSNLHNSIIKGKTEKIKTKLQKKLDKKQLNYSEEIISDYLLKKYRFT